MRICFNCQCCVVRKVLGMDYRLIEQSPLSFPFPSIKCLKLTKGRSSRVHHPSKEVMDYLTAHDESLVVEFLEDVRFVRNKIWMAAMRTCHQIGIASYKSACILIYDFYVIYLHANCNYKSSLYVHGYWFFFHDFI